jgi:hypothetical protein
MARALGGLRISFDLGPLMPDEFGRTVTFEPIEGDPDRVLMIETLDLTHPNSPIIKTPWVDLPADFEWPISLTRRIPVPKWVAQS